MTRNPCSGLKCYLLLLLTITTIKINRVGGSFAAAAYRTFFGKGTIIYAGRNRFQPHFFGRNNRMTTISLSSSNHVGENIIVDPELLKDLKISVATPLILGSGSYTRKLIIGEMNLPFEVIVFPIDERNIGDRSKDPPSDLVMTLAKAKAKALVEHLQQQQDANYNDRIMLTADQVVTCNGKILEKPESIEEAKEFVSKYGNFPPSTVGSIVLTHLPSCTEVSGVDTATIHFDGESLQKEKTNLIDQLLSCDPPAPVLSCAGGLMVEHPLVEQHIRNIVGTQDSVMGLSKSLLIELLQELKQKLNE